MRYEGLLLLGVLASGCGVALSQTSGGAFAAPGVASGDVRSIRISDKGGPLARTGLALISGARGAGAVRNVRVVEETATTRTYEVTYDTAAMAAANRIAEQANAREVPFEGSLEIALRSLGGDTSGWMFQWGMSSELLALHEWLVARVFLGLAGGQYTHYGRTLRAPAELGVSAHIASVDYNYFGVQCAAPFMRPILRPLCRRT